MNNQKRTHTTHIRRSRDNDDRGAKAAKERKKAQSNVLSNIVNERENGML